MHRIKWILDRRIPYTWAALSVDQTREHSILNEVFIGTQLEQPHGMLYSVHDQTVICTTHQVSDAHQVGLYKC